MSRLIRYGLALCLLFITQSVQAANPVISGTPDLSVFAGEVYSFKPSATDADNDALTFVIQNKPDWANFSDSTGRLSGRPSAAERGRYARIRIGVSDGSSTSWLDFFTLVVANNAPEISGVPTNKVKVGDAYSFVPEASDVDGDPLSFGIQKKPGWGSFDEKTGALTGTIRNADAGKIFENIVITVRDGEGGKTSLPAFFVEVESNNKPVISGEPATEVFATQPYRFKPKASDADGDKLTFIIEGKPEWASFSAKTGVFQGTPKPKHRGRTAELIKIAVTDGVATSNLKAFKINVKNNVPTISGKPKKVVDIGEKYSFIPEANDAEDDLLTFSIKKKPIWASFDEKTGALTGTIRAQDAGKLFEGITITVRDDQGAKVSLAPFNIQVENNAAPVISGEPAKEVLAKKLYKFKPKAVDDDGDKLTFSIEGKPEWAKFNTKTGVLQGKPKPQHRGKTELPIKISVTDGISTSSLGAFKIVIKNNDPKVSGKPKSSVDIGEQYTFKPKATDKEKDTLTFQVKNRPQWLKLDKATGQLQGTPGLVDEGIKFKDITVTVIDSEGGKASLAPFSIQVKNNESPVISGSPAESVLAQAEYSFIPKVKDKENDPITFSIKNKPDWASFDEVTGELSGTPTSADRGRYPGIRIGASDGKETTLTDIFAIKVLNNEPTLSGTPEASIVAGETYVFKPKSGDIDGDTLNFKIKNKPKWADFNANTGKLSGIPRTKDERGTTEGILITVLDGEGGKKVLPEFDITVVERNRLPYISGLPEKIAPVSEPYTFIPRARDENTEAEIEFSIKNKPAWLNFNKATGKLSGTPTSADVGTYGNIVISVNDERGGSASLDAFDLTVDNTAMTRLQAYRLLTQATFGPTAEALDAAMSQSPEQWLNGQFNKASAYDRANDAHQTHLQRTIEIATTAEPSTDWFRTDNVFNKGEASTSVLNYQMSAWLENAIGHPSNTQHGQDQLRQRVAYALSQLLVVSDFAPPLDQRGEALAAYYDILAKHAFGNYRDLLGEMARSPAMGVYLSHQGNRKTDLATSTRPDENFAREVIQLFSIGLFELNLDGTPNRDGNHLTFPDSGSTVVPTYTQNDVVEMSKVMTGWDLVSNRIYGLNRGKQGDYTVQMEFTAAEHEDEVATGGDGNVTVMGSTFALNSGADGSGMDSALDVLFAHPNIAPFVSKHLIMRLVTSNPSSDYVARVAAVFNDNGDGVKGDLKAVVKAILLDTEARDGALSGAVAGKAREPLIAMTHFLRAHDVRPIDGWTGRDGSTIVNGVYWYRKPQADLGQAPLRSPSVFNFYDADFVPSDSFFADNRLVAPEVQIQTDQMLLEYNNQVATFLDTFELNQVTRVAGQTLNEFVSDKDYSFTRALMLIDLSDELAFYERALDGDANGDFARMNLTNPETDIPYKEKAVDDLLDRLDQTLLGGQMTDKYRAALKLYLLEAAGSNNEDSFLEAMANVQDVIRLITTSSAFMVHE